MSAGSTEPGRLEAGADLTVDEGALVGYQAGRGGPGPLVLGAGATVRSGSVLYTGTTIGERFTTGHGVVVREENLIGDDVAVWSHSVIDYGCVIGDGVKIHTKVYVAQFTFIGEGAFLAPGVTCANDLYPGDERSASLMAGPIVEAGAQIGAGSTLLPGVRIGAGAIVGAGSTVVHDVPPGMVVAGNPARLLRPVDQLEPIENRMDERHPLRAAGANQ